MERDTAWPVVLFWELVAMRKSMAGPVKMQTRMIALVMMKTASSWEVCVLAWQTRPATITVTTTGPAYVDGWIDFNQDGSWNGPDERILANVAVQNGQNILSFNVPARAAYGMTYARFRISSQVAWAHREKP